MQMTCFNKHFSPQSLPDGLVFPGHFEIIGGFYPLASNRMLSKQSIEGEREKRKLRRRGGEGAGEGRDGDGRTDGGTFSNTFRSF
jgi:hypothetical protein